MKPPMAVGAYSRTMTAGLITTCVALATSVVLTASLFLPGVPSAPIAQAGAGLSVSVFGEDSAPRVRAPSTGATAVDSSAPTARGASEPGAPVAALASTATVDAAAGAPAAGVFDDETMPAAPVDSDVRSVELGLRFTPRLDGAISALRFYRTSANAGPHVGTLWGPEGEALARVSFEAGASEGWQTAEVSPAVPVHAGTTYTASYHAPGGRYAADEHYFDRAHDTEYLAVGEGAGVYAYGSGAYPREVYRNSNYYVDVVFQPGDAAAPLPTASPAPTAAPEPTATLEPTASPEPTATPEPTASAEPQPGTGDQSVLGDDTPGSPVDPDRDSVELGMRFVPKTDGEITALRLYRTAANASPHVATLWDASGTRLARASVTSSGEGWQTAALSSPVALTAGQQYVVSYLAPAGGYSADEHYFDVGIENDYFSVPVGAGVYAYGTGGFPTRNYRNSNYYVDVRFAPDDEPRPVPTSTPTTTSTPTPTASPAPTPRPTPTTVPTPTPTPTPAPVPGQPGGTDVLDLPTEAWWGGPAYYAQWSKASQAGWTDESFFPISVFFGKPSHADELASLGVNTYMGAEHDGSPMSMITSQGISVLAQDEWSAQEVGDDPRVVGWHVSDECDMGYSGCTPDWNDDNGEYGRLDVQRRYVDRFRSLNDGRFLQANFGNGVLGTWWAPNTMDDHLALVDASSVDKYAYTSPGVGNVLRESSFWPRGKNPASAGAYGWQQDRMETFMSPAASKPNWVFVETARPFLEESGARTITGDQIEGAVWNAIIHGAAGIAYFQHNNNGSCGTYSLVECSAALKAKVKDVNASVTSLAPVINSPSYVWNFGAGLETSLKAKDGSAYILAMTDGGTGSRTFTVPAGLSGTVEVVGEGRTLSITDGSFTDAFAAEHDHHIYRIALG